MDSFIQCEALPAAQHNLLALAPQAVGLSLEPDTAPDGIGKSTATSNQNQGMTLMREMYSAWRRRLVGLNLLHLPTYATCTYFDHLQLSHCLPANQLNNNPNNPNSVPGSIAAAATAINFNSTNAANNSSTGTSTS